MSLHMMQLFIMSPPRFNAMTIAKLPICLGLPGTVPVYICCLRVIINSVPFYSPKGPPLDDKFYGHPIHRLPHQTCSACNAMHHQSAKNLPAQPGLSFFLNICWSADDPSLSTIHAMSFSIHLYYL